MSRFFNNLIEHAFVLGISFLILSLFFGGFVESYMKDRPDCTITSNGDPRLVFQTNPLLGAPKTVYVCPFQGPGDIPQCMKTAYSLGCKKPGGGSIAPP